MDRRTTLKWVLAASAAWPLARLGAAANVPAASAGYGTDPDLARNYQAGDLWPLTLTPAQRALAGVLSDLIIPADEHSPSASAIGIVDFIDAWVSAPYPTFQRDRGVVLGGFIWLDEESAGRFNKSFAALDAGGQRAICNDICEAARAPSALREAARFFALYRDLTAGGFYSSDAGRKDLRYIGNVPLKAFEGPPPALLKSLGLPLHWPEKGDGER